jgi:dTDP-4-dehydrorhamnose reductase
VAKALLETGAYVLFLSTDTVFYGTSPLPEEWDRPHPVGEYGRQKAEVEARLLDLDGGRGQVGICRLTKVLTPESPIVKTFVAALASGRTVDAFADLRISPISLDHVVDGLLRIAERRLGGIFHLSGQGFLSYSGAGQGACPANEG